MIAISLLLGGSIAIASSMFYNPSKAVAHNGAADVTGSSNNSTGGNASDGGVTKDVGSDNTPPQGETVFTFSGTGQRRSHVVDLAFPWVALWSADCSGEGSPNSLVISLLYAPSTGSVTKGGITQTILNDTLSSRIYESGTVDGKPATAVQLEVSSQCDWTVSVIKTS